jgi:hypothetical protein
MSITPLFGAGDCTTITSANNTSRTIDKPANVADGDLLVAYIYSQFNGGTVTAVPSGWTLAKGLGTRTGGVYYKAVPSAAAETAANYTWTISNSGRMAFTMFRVTGVDLSRPLDAVGSEYAQSATNPFNAPSVSAGGGHLLMSFLYWNASSATTSVVTPDGALTDGIQASSPTTGNTSGTDIAWQRITSSGATGTRSMSLSPVDASHSALLLTFNEGGAAVLSGSGTLSASGSALTGGISGYLAQLSGEGTLSATGGTPNFTPTVALFGGGLLRAHANGPMDVLLAKSTMYVAHRGGSLSWPYEETLQAYTYASRWAPADVLAFEVSVWRSSDGVWVASHDQTTGRVFPGPSYDIPTTPWSTLSTLTTSGYPIARLDDILAAFPDRAFLVENKGAQAMSTFLSLLDANGGPGRFIVKAYGGNSGVPAAARAAGYYTWGYYWDVDTSLLDSTQVNWDLLGEDYTAAPSTWTKVTSYGKRVLAHVLPNAAAKATADSYGAYGYMAAAVEDIVPQTPAQAAFSGSGALQGVPMNMASLTGEGTLSADAAPTPWALVEFSGTGTLSVLTPVIALAELAGEGTLTVQTSSVSRNIVITGDLPDPRWRGNLSSGRVANVYQRESVEFQPVNVTVDGSPVIADLLFAIVRDGQRPVTFSPGYVIGTESGVMIAGLEPGTYRIYAQVTAAWPETPVLDCGYFYIY